MKLDSHGRNEMLLISRVFFDFQQPDEGLSFFYNFQALCKYFLSICLFVMINEVDALLGDFYRDQCRDF